jgi:hypothetical protein
MRQGGCTLALCRGCRFLSTSGTSGEPRGKKSTGAVASFSVCRVYLADLPLRHPDEAEMHTLVSCADEAALSLWSLLSGRCSSYVLKYSPELKGCYWFKRSVPCMPLKLTTSLQKKLLKSLFYEEEGWTDISLCIEDMHGASEQRHHREGGTQSCWGRSMAETGQERTPNL